MEAPFENMRKWPSIHPTHFQRQGHIYSFGLMCAYGQLVTFDVHAGSE